jgi:hypothetical protein
MKTGHPVEVACPACHAPAGLPCRSRSGKIADTHYARTVAAGRAARDERAFRLSPFLGWQ